MRTRLVVSAAVVGISLSITGTAVAQSRPPENASTPGDFRQRCLDSGGTYTEGYHHTTGKTVKCTKSDGTVVTCENWGYRIANCKETPKANEKPSSSPMSRPTYSGPNSARSGYGRG